MLSGLDKALLKRMWDMIAGNAGSLNAEQFIKCMYIMDGCRRGAQLPAALPPGPWPQVRAMLQSFAAISYTALSLCHSTLHGRAETDAWPILFLLRQLHQSPYNPTETPCT